MQGIVIDEERNYVKAAIVKVFKMQDLSDDSDTEAETVTYALTDEDGRFVIKDLDPDDNYTIEIRVEETIAKGSEAAVDTDSKGAEDDFSEIKSMDKVVDFIEADNKDEVVDFIEADNKDEVVDFIEADNEVEAVDFIEADSIDEEVDFIEADSMDETFIFVQKEELARMYFTSDLRPETELKEKLYTIKNYTW